MAREDLHFRLRIPEDVKNKIEEWAEINRRSMTAEIIDRLEKSFSWPAISLPADAQELTNILPMEIMISVEEEINSFAAQRLRQAARSHGVTSENLLSMFNALISDESYENQPELVAELKDLLTRAGIDYPSGEEK